MKNRVDFFAAFLVMLKKTLIDDCQQASLRFNLEFVRRFVYSLQSPLKRGYRIVLDEAVFP